MSYIEKARQNRLNAEKAQAFDGMQQRQRDQQAYTTGADDAYTDVERRLMERAQQEEMQRRLYEAARNQTFANQDVRGPEAIPVLPAPEPSPVGGDGLAASVQSNMRDNAYTNAMVRAQSEGNLSEDYINKLVEEELNKRGGL